MIHLRAPLLIKWLLPWLLTFSALAAVSPFNTYVDKTEITEGETIELTLEFILAHDGDPDLTGLEKKFDILSRSKSFETNMINGAVSKKTKWIYTIAPKTNDKKITIDPIPLGRYRSEPIEIRVVESTGSGHDGIDFFAQVNSQSVYVSQEIILRVELKTTKSLRSGSISQPEIKDAIVETLIDDDNSQQIINGVKHYIFKRAYSIFPTKPGRITIPTITFDGTVAADRSRSRAWSGFFSNGQRIRAKTKALEIEVKDVPPSYPPGQPFLPVKSLTIIESFASAQPKFDIGQATTRNFEVKALGSLATFLPKVAVPEQFNGSVYHEEGNNIQKSTIDGIESSVKFSHVFMPNAPGRTSIPAQKIYWWDVDNDKLKSTQIRGLDIVVAGDAAPAVAPEEGETALSQATGAPANGDAGFDGKIWLVLAVIFFTLWLLTLILFFKKYGGIKVIEKNRPPKDSDNILQEKIDEAKKLIKLKDMAGALRPLREMQVMAHENNDEKLGLLLRAIISPLEKSIYGGQGKEKQGDISQEALEKLSALKAKPKAPEVLAPVYRQ